MAKKTRELGEPTQEDILEMRDVAEVITMDNHSVLDIYNMLLNIWALGHNQGYEDANTERDEL